MHIAMIRRSGIMVLAVAVTACGGNGGRGSEVQWQAVSDTVGDTVTVRTLSGSVWGDTAYLEPEVTIGMMDGPDEYLIGNPRSVVVSDDGVIYMLDRQVPIIRAYGPDGTHLRDIGREGGGPGEYKNPGSMAMLSDGRLLVRDPGNGRLSLFAPDGEYLGQQWYPGGFNTSRRLYRDTAGYVHSMVLLNYGTSPWDWEFGLARIDPDAGIMDTVAVPAWDYKESRITGSREDGSSSTSDRVPFAARVHWSFSPLGYIVGGVSSEYRIDLFRTTEPVLRIERDWTPLPVSREEAEEQRRRATYNMRQQYPGWKWNGSPVPDTKPPFRGMFVSAEGNLWILVSQEARVSMTEAEAREEEQRTGWPQIRHTQPSAYDVFDCAGRFLGHVRVPGSFGTYPEPFVRGDYVWAVTRDELDVASIVRYRLVLPDRP